MLCECNYVYVYEYEYEYVYVYYMCTLCLGKSEEGSRSNGTKVASDKLTYLCWGPANPTHVLNKSIKRTKPLSQLSRL